MQKNNDNIINGPIFKNMLLFTVPIILSGVIQLLYNACDIVVVGRYAGSNSLAAVGSTSALTNLLINLFIGLSTGAGVCVAHFIGADEKEAQKKTVHTSIAIAIISGIFLLLVGFFFSNTFLKMMDTPENIIGEATLYMQIIFLGMPAQLVYNFGSAIIRANGDTKSPLIYLSVSGIINVILNLILVILFNRSADGVATATIISQILSAILVIIHLSKLNGPLKLNIKKLSIDKKILIKISKIGIPAGIQGALFSISNVQIQSAINGFSSAAVAGNASASNLEGFVYTAMNSTHQALLTYTGQNLGAGKYDRLKKIIIIGCLQVTMIGMFSSALFYIFKTPLLNLYTPGDTEVIKYAVSRLQIILPVYFICGLMEAFAGSLRGMGYSTLPMLVSILGICGIRMFWIYYIFPHFNTLTCLYISYPVSQGITGTVHAISCAVVIRKLNKHFNKNKSVAN